MIIERSTRDINMIKKKNTSVHVLNNKTKWAIRKRNDTQVKSVYHIKRAAEKGSDSMAKDEAGQYIVHHYTGNLKSPDHIDPLPKARKVLYPVNLASDKKKEIRIVISDIINESRSSR